MASSYISTRYSFRYFVLLFPSPFSHVLITNFDNEIEVADDIIDNAQFKIKTIQKDLTLSQKLHEDYKDN